jgi:hypothetical protein
MSGGATETVVAGDNCSLRIFVNIEVVCARGQTVAYGGMQSQIEIAVIQQPVPSNFNLMTTH